MLWGLVLDVDDPQTTTLTHGLHLTGAEIIPKVKILSPVRLYCKSTKKDAEYVICTFSKGETKPVNFLKLVLAKGDCLTFRAVQDVKGDDSSLFAINLTGTGYQ